MPLQRPTLSQLAARTRADLANLLPDLDPTVPGSFIRALVESFAFRINAGYIFIVQAARECFLQTATGIGIERFAAMRGLSRSPASGATGEVVFYGTSLAAVPIGTAVTSASGQPYQTLQALELTQQAISISALSQIGGVATAVATGHPLASGQDFAISGAVDIEYNGNFKIAVLDANTFQYPVDAGANSPTSGTIVGLFTGAQGTIDSLNKGVATNLGSGARVTLVSPLPGVQSVALVRFDGVTGGAELESDDALRARALEAFSAIQTSFGPETLSVQAKTVSGVTRVKVLRAMPDPGDVTVLFVRDGDANIIPSAADVANVRARLLPLLPSTSEEDFLIVSAPTPVEQDFVFSALSPNNEAMRNAIRETLVAFYEDEVQIGTSIAIEDYRAAIMQSVAGDDALTSFTLTSPTTAISIDPTEISVLGEVTFP